MKKLFVMIGDGQKYLGSVYEVKQLMETFRNQVAPYSKIELESQQTKVPIRAISYILECEDDKRYALGQAIITLHWPNVEVYDFEYDYVELKPTLTLSQWKELYDER